MRKLTKEQQEKKAQLVEALRCKEDALQTALDTFLKEIDTKWREQVEPVIKDYNATIDVAQALVDEVAEAAIAYSVARSVNWQNGIVGETYTSWAYEWDCELDRVNMETPSQWYVDDLIGFDIRVSDELNRLENAPE